MKATAQLPRRPGSPSSRRARVRRCSSRSGRSPHRPLPPPQREREPSLLLRWRPRAQRRQRATSQQAPNRHGVPARGLRVQRRCRPLRSTSQNRRLAHGRLLARPRPAHVVCRLQWRESSRPIRQWRARRCSSAAAQQPPHQPRAPLPPPRRPPPNRLVVGSQQLVRRPQLEASPSRLLVRRGSLRRSVPCPAWAWARLFLQGRREEPLLCVQRLPSLHRECLARRRRRAHLSRRRLLPLRPNCRVAIVRRLPPHRHLLLPPNLLRGTARTARPPKLV